MGSYLFQLYGRVHHPKVKLIRATRRGCELTWRLEHSTLAVKLRAWGRRGAAAAARHLLKQLPNIGHCKHRRHPAAPYQGALPLPAKAATSVTAPPPASTIFIKVKYFRLPDNLY